MVREGGKKGEGVCAAGLSKRVTLVAILFVIVHSVHVAFDH